MTTRPLADALTVSTPTNAGVMSAADKTKLDGVQAGATANDTDAALRDRSTHTGTQLAATISDLPEAVQDIIGAALLAGAGVTVTYDDTAGTITIAATVDNEAIDDRVAALIQAGTGVTVTYDDTAGTLTIASTVSDEVIDDRVAALLVAGANITITYDDVLNTLTIASTGGGGASAMDDLTDVDAPSPDPDDLLQWNGTAWVNVTVAALGVLDNPMAGVGDLIVGSTPVDISALVNEALNIVPTGSTTLSSAAAMTDGTTATEGFMESDPINEWIKVDLGVAKEITAFRIYHVHSPGNGSRAATYRIEYSTDNVAWSTAHTVTSVTQDDSGIVILPIPYTARYWRIYGLTSSSGSNWWVIRELGFYSGISVSPPARLGAGANGQRLAIVNGVPAWVAGVVAVARRTTAQSIANNTTTIIDFATVDNDADSRITTGAAWKFTSNKAAWYQVNASIQMDSGSYLAQLFLYKNGASLRSLYRWPSGDYPNPQGSSLVYLDVGDYIDVRLLQTSGVSKNTFVDNVGTYVTIHEVS